MEKISVFISYSSEEKAVAGRLKRYLQEYCGYNVFIAHEDIQPSSEWEREIMETLRQVDYFIPLLSNNFKTSDFTDQEVGAAICMNKKIIPVKLERVNPYGFMRKYHAFQLRQRSERNGESSDNLLQIATQVALLSEYYSEGDLNLRRMNSAAFALRNSRSFDMSNIVIKIICSMKGLESDHIEYIRDSISANFQVKYAFGLKDLCTYLEKQYGVVVDLNN